MIDVVIPTIGRPSLADVLASIARSTGPRPGRIVIVDDRRDARSPLDLGELDAELRERITVIAGRARGPAAARNDGWRASAAVWIAFLDDDVVVEPSWLDDLARDLDALASDVAGSTGRVRVPLPAARRPTDWERNVAGLATARWITADCAYRRADLVACGGFDERFRRAYREDSDIALRLVAMRKRIVSGMRGVVHPVRPAPWTVSIRLQAGNRDDALMDALHGDGWRERAGAARGAFPTHVATVAAAGLALVAAPLDRRASGIALGAWAALAARFAWQRIAPGPRDAREIATMAATSLAIPFAAVFYAAQGRCRYRGIA